MINKSASFKCKAQAKVIAKRLQTFEGYDLIAMCIPEDARPCTEGKGGHNYTMKNESNTAVIEVQLKNQAFRIKKTADPAGIVHGATKLNFCFKSFSGPMADWTSSDEIELVSKTTTPGVRSRRPSGLPDLICFDW